MKAVVVVSSLLSLPLASGLRGELGARLTHRNLKETDTQLACANAIDLIPDDYVCECTDLNVNQTLLSCLDTTCTYCSSDSSVCGSGMYEEVFGLLGATDFISETFMYSKSLNDTVTIGLSDCELDEVTGESVCTSCTVMVNDVECDTCFLQNCTEGSSAGVSVPVFNCEGALIDLCTDDAVYSGVFQYLSTAPGEFENCTLTTEAPSGIPSVSPTDTPSAIPSDMPSLMPSQSPTTSAPTISAAPTSNSTEAMSPAPTPGEAASTGTPGEAAPTGTPEETTTGEPVVSPTQAPFTFPPEPSTAPARGGSVVATMAIIAALVCMW